MHLKKSYSSSNNAHSAPSYPIPRNTREKKYIYIGDSGKLYEHK